MYTRYMQCRYPIPGIMDGRYYIWYSKKVGRTRYEGTRLVTLYNFKYIPCIPSHSSRSSVEQTKHPKKIQKHTRDFFFFSFVQSWNHTTKSTFCSKIFRISISHSLFCCFRINKFNPTITI